MDLIRNNYILVGLLILIGLLTWSKQNKKNTTDHHVILNIISKPKELLNKMVKSVNNDKSNPKQIDYAAGAVIDLFNNNQPAVFIGQGRDQSDLLLINQNNRVINIIDQTNLNDSNFATYSAVSADIDHNGLPDLIVARENGIFLYTNRGRGKFTKSKISNVDPNAIPYALAVTDYNKDGHIDIYVSQESNPKSKLSGNMLLEGLGAGSFENVTDLTHMQGQSGKAKWIDLNGDKLPDLVLMRDGGELMIYENTRGASGAPYTSGNTFKPVKVPSGLGYVNDVDIIDTNADGIPDMMINRQIILHNQGNFNFTSTEMENDLDQGWSSILSSIGKKIGSNIKWINTSGPTKIYSDQAKQPENWVGIKLPNSVPYLNATVHVVSKNDHTGQIRKQTRQYTNSSGLGQIPSNVMFFNLGNDHRILRLEVYSIYDGNRWIHPNPKINMIATFRDYRSNYYTHRSRDMDGQLPLNKSAILGLPEPFCVSN